MRESGRRSPLRIPRLTARTIGPIFAGKYLFPNVSSGRALRFFVPHWSDRIQTRQPHGRRPRARLSSRARIRRPRAARWFSAPATWRPFDPDGGGAREPRSGREGPGGEVKVHQELLEVATSAEGVPFLVGPQRVGVAVAGRDGGSQAVDGSVEFFGPLGSRHA
jgi:hypothetical protein